VTTLPESQKRIKLVGEEIIDFLLEKNDQYGDSALEPNRIFSQADTVEQIKVRIDAETRALDEVMWPPERVGADGSRRSPT